MARKTLPLAIDGKDVPTEIIAESIVDISQGVKKMRAGKLNDKAIIILLSHASGVTQHTCRRILDSLENLESKYLRKKEK